MRIPVRPLAAAALAGVGLVTALGLSAAAVGRIQFTEMSGSWTVSIVGCS